MLEMKEKVNIIVVFKPKKVSLNINKPHDLLNLIFEILESVFHLLTGATSTSACIYKYAVAAVARFFSSKIIFLRMKPLLLGLYHT